MKKYNITMKGRYTRLLFLITKKFTYESIQSIIFENQNIWGGRFNPIVEIDDNQIPTKYLKHVHHHDPDIVYFEQGIDIQKILQTYNITPHYTEAIDLENPWTVIGTNTYFFAREYKTHKVVFPGTGYWKIEDNLKDWYRLNFGLNSYTNYGDQRLTRENPILEITAENYGNLLTILAENDQLLFRTTLSESYAERELDTTPQSEGEFMEFIIGDLESRDELLYFANRARFKNKGLIYFTIDDFKTLINRNDFWHFIRAQRFVPKIKLKTSKYEIEYLESLLYSSQYKIANKNFSISKIESFPYDSSLEETEKHYTIFQTTQSLITENGIISLPSLPKSIEPEIHGWSVDISLQDVTDSPKPLFTLPKYTKTSQIIGTKNSRVNSENTISCLVDHDTTKNGVIALSIPTAEEIIKLRLTSAIPGTESDSQIYHCKRSDDSNRLIALLNIIDHDFDYLEKVLDDYFWGDWIRSISKKENVTSFSSQTVKEAVSAALLKTNKGAVEIFEEGQVGHNLEKKVKNAINEFCNKKLFFKGYKVKCPTCSSATWYPLNVLKNELTCPGCQNNTAFPVDPEMHFVVNDLLRKNIYRTPTDPDGNLTVIRSLAKLREHFNSFYFSPQLEVYRKNNHSKPIGDLDLICVGDGKLIIGECKHDSKAFLEKDKNGANSLDKLVEIARIVKPDLIVLSCTKDENEKLDKAKKYMTRKMRENPIGVFSIKIGEKKYFSMEYIYKI